MSRANFRPLSGSRYFKWKQKNEKNRRKIWFPSPFGVSLFQIQKQESLRYVEGISVPFRGLVISNKEKRKRRENENENFRPLSGSRYFKSILFAFFNLAERISVPFRGLVISNLTPLIVVPDGISDFRPLSGSRYFKLPELIYKLLLKDFRPLSGSRYFKCSNWRIIDAIDSISVPFRGLVISNHKKMGA